MTPLRSTSRQRRPRPAAATLTPPAAARSRPSQQRIAQLRDLIAAEKVEKEALLRVLHANQAKLDKLRAVHSQLQAEVARLEAAQAGAAFNRA